MKAFKILVLIVVSAFCIFDSVFAFETDWWRDFSCVTPKMILKIKAGANDSSETVKTCACGEKLRVVYGRKTLVFNFDKNCLVEEKWFEVKFTDRGQFIYGWVKASEVDECNS